MKKVFLSALVFSALGAGANAQTAEDVDFVRTAVGSDREVAQYVGGSEKWTGGVVNWYYNPANQPRNLSTADVVTTIQIAASRWAQMCNLTFNYMGLSSANRNFQGMTIDKVNVVGWQMFPSNMKSSSGVAYWNYSSSDTTMVDADIFLNTYYKWSLTDVDAVMTHEFGHAIGLQHSNVSQSIMFANPYNSYAYQRTLRGDDVAGCSAKYGASPNAWTNRTLNWAEQEYASLLGGGPAVTLGQAGYTYRYYGGSQSYAGTKDGVAYYMGPDGVIQNLGLLSDFSSRVTAAGF